MMPDETLPAENESPEVTSELVPDPDMVPDSAMVADPAMLAESGGGAIETDTIEQPAKIMRMAAMLRQLLAEIRADTLDEMSRNRLGEIYQTSLEELGDAVSADLREELDRLTMALDENKAPSQDELRVVKAQLVGWLEGLIQGIQATLFARQVAAQNQMAQARAPLPPGRTPPPTPRSGTYL